ncbi:MAG: hypothetical protein RLZZ453_864 [Chlamydiota bacterium]|jgi:hypothetical protein
MNRFVASLTALSLMTAPLLSDAMDNYQKAANDIFVDEEGADDNAFTSIATSMIGWAVGLAFGIAILASVIPQSTGSHATTAGND